MLRAEARSRRRSWRPGPPRSRLPRRRGGANARPRPKPKATEMRSAAIAGQRRAGVNHRPEIRQEAFKALATAPNQKFVVVPSEMSGLGSIAGIGELAKSALGGDGPSPAPAPRRPARPGPVGLGRRRRQRARRADDRNRGATTDSSRRDDLLHWFAGRQSADRRDPPPTFFFIWFGIAAVLVGVLHLAAGQELADQPDHRAAIASRSSGTPPTRRTAPVRQRSQPAARRYLGRPVVGRPSATAAARSRSTTRAGRR